MASIKRLDIYRLLVVIALWVFWSTAVSTSWSRIAALQTIEPYAFAVHEQLLFNFAQEGQFFQTIHSGYDNNWTWSGHRALTLPVVGYLYGLYPSAVWLSIILISVVALGAFPAGWLGKKYLRHKRGFFWGAFIYLICPATSVLALQDYQDLVLALPCLMFGFWCYSTGKLWLVVLGTVVAMAPREECVPMALCASILFWQKSKWIWLRNVLVTATVLFYYVQWAEYLYPLSGGHDMPLENAVGSLRRGRIFLEGWLSIEDFYSLVWVPLGIFAFFSPITAAAGIALCLLHMTVPQGHGVDRSWAGHCHHMAPAVAFAVAATIVGSCRLGYLLRRLPLHRFFGVCLIAWSVWWWGNWAQYYHLNFALYPKSPEWYHPAWTLADQIPRDAAPVVSRRLSIVASSFSHSYTFDESLYLKQPTRGLAAATHAIVDSRRQNVMSWLQKMEGFTQQAEVYPFVLVSWNVGAQDPSRKQKPKFPHVQAWTGPYVKGSDIPGVPLHEVVPAARQVGGFPIIDLWRNVGR